MSKQFYFDADGRRELQKGTAKLARAIKVTVGPTGRNVLLSKPNGSGKISKDGMDIAKELELEHSFETMGIKLLQEVATRTHKEVGDGTVTAMLLAERMMQHGERYIAAGVSPLALRRGMEKATKKAVEALAEISQEVKGRKAIEQVGSLASKNDIEIGKLFAEAISVVGPRGVVTVEENDGIDTRVELIDGMDIDKGYLSPYFITSVDTKMVEFENPYILITDKKISAIQELVPVLEQIMAQNRPLIVVAEDVDGDALAALIVNRLRAALPVAAIKAPGFGDRRKAMLEDLSVLCGGTFFSKDVDFDIAEAKLDQLGTCKKVEISKDNTVFFKGAGKKSQVEQRIRHIEAQMDQSTSSYDREKLQERIGKLNGSIAIVKVGGLTELEIKERKQRVEVALSATRAAMEEGIVPGGGTAYVRILPIVASTSAAGDEKLGVEVVTNALPVLLESIAKNVGEDGPAIVAEVEENESTFGFNALSCSIVDLQKKGIMDPSKVLRVALQNATSIASLSLVSDTIIADIPKGKEAEMGATY